VSVVANMVKGIKVHQVGGPEVLKWEDIEVKEPGEGEVKVKHTAVGVNYIDVNYRNGAYSTSTPFIPGFEAAGVVTAVGPGLTGLKVGDRVAYAGRGLTPYQKNCQEDEFSRESNGWKSF
jgi:NADPH2:quinone reductase